MTDNFSRDARWSFGIFISRSIGSLLFVVVASRQLGSDGFGTLAGLSALTSLAGVLVSNGLGHAVTMFASRSDTGNGRLLREATRGALLVGVLTLPVYLAAATWIVGVSVVAAVALFVADVVIAGASELVGSVLIGMRRFRGAFGALGMPAITRILAAGVVFLGTFESVEAVTLVAGAASIGALPVVLFLGAGVCETPGKVVSLRSLASASRVFVAGNVVTRINNDFDKLLLPVQLGAVTSVGSYALGYRLVEYSLLPLMALSTAAYPRLFRAGSDGASSAIATARRLAKFYIATGVLIAVGLVLVRGQLSWLFGDTYEELPVVIGALAVFPLLRSLTNVFSEPLTGSGHHGRRVLASSVGATVNIGVNVALISTWGWKAAVAATYASEVVQLVIVLVVNVRLNRAERAPNAVPVAADASQAV